MITFNRISRFGKYAKLNTQGFNCIISTAPGLFKGSTLVYSIGRDGRVKRTPVAKAYLSRKISRAARDATHDYFVRLLDEMGSRELRLIEAIETAFPLAKSSGRIVDFIVSARKSKKRLSEAEQKAFVDFVANVLAIQMEDTDNTMEDVSGRVNRKALGYIYGFIDAALRRRGVNMKDVEVGVPATYSVLNRLFGSKAQMYTEYLIEHIGKDQVLMLGVMHGGQQYVDWKNSKGEKVPMGLGIFMIEGDRR